jgi:hypothetical protein
MIWDIQFRWSWPTHLLAKSYFLGDLNIVLDYRLNNLFPMPPTFLAFWSCHNICWCYQVIFLFQLVKGCTPISTLLYEKTREWTIWINACDEKYNASMDLLFLRYLLGVCKYIQSSVHFFLKTLHIFFNKISPRLFGQNFHWQIIACYLGYVQIYKVKHNVEL